MNTSLIHSRGPAPASRPGPHAQRGAAALIVTAVLCFAMLLVTLFLGRNLVFEQRSAANQYRSTLAFEAAEAGLEWALAQLNNAQPLDAACSSSNAAGASSFRQRHLSFQRSNASHVPVTWNNAGVATALRPSCVRSGAGWACSCPAQGAPALTAPSGENDPAPAFSVQFQAGDKPGVIRVIATGCSSLAGPCNPGSTAAAPDAVSRSMATFGLAPGLTVTPVAALTARGPVDAAALGAHNPQPAGLAIHAGGALTATPSRLSGAAGAAAGASIVAGDSPLAALTPSQFFASYFGMDIATWQGQPAVQQVGCAASDCGAALLQAAGNDMRQQLLFVPGDLELAGPLTLGTPERPVLIVATGAARLSGAVRLHGVIYSASLAWNAHSGPGALLRGAAITAGGYSGDAATDLHHDAAVLATLQGNSGSFVRVGGSWRDF